MLEAREKVFGHTHPDTLISISHLGGALEGHGAMSTGTKISAIPKSIVTSQSAAGACHEVI